MLETSVIITILGAFLLVLICIELLDTIKAYFYENTIHVEIVILLAIIAISRKVILLDPTGTKKRHRIRGRNDGDRGDCDLPCSGISFLKKAGISTRSVQPEEK